MTTVPLMPDSDDALIVLGLPRARIYGPRAPQMATVFATWGSLACDAITGTPFTVAALSLVLYQLQTVGVIRDLRVFGADTANELMSAQWRYTARGERVIAVALDLLSDDDDLNEMSA